MTNALAAPTLDPPVSNRLEPLRPLPVHAVQRAMAEYQDGLHAILADNDWQTFADKDGRERRFVKRSGWRKIATWFGLDMHIGDVVVDRDANGQPLRARVVGRVVAPSGRMAEDVGGCSIDERRFSKPEHDLIATAATRALNRATANLVGMGEVTAEELTDVDVDFAPSLPSWAADADINDADAMHAKLVELVGQNRADALSNAIVQRYDGVPVVVTGIVTALHSMLAAELVATRTPTTTE